MDWYTTLEIVAVMLSLGFLILLIRENVWCWPFGIVSSGLSILLFVEAKLYSEAVLYFFYVLIGVYGWWKWTRGSGEGPLRVSELSRIPASMTVLIGAAGAAIIGYFFYTKSDAAHPFIDATTTSFSFVASFLEAKKVLSAWIYWIIINATSIWLYFDRGLLIYSGLMVIYFIVSLYGWYSWNLQLKQTNT
jgi:nicotinamide mononucleotide transporter